MKRHRRIVPSFILAAVLSLSAFRLAVAEEASMDPVKVGPNIYKKIYENDRVRLLEASLKVGDKIDMHTHPDHLAYILEGGSITITVAGKEPQTMAAKAGDALWLEAQTHSAVNVGVTPIHILVVELKEPRMELRKMDKMEKKPEMKPMKEMKK